MQINTQARNNGNYDILVGGNDIVSPTKTEGSRAMKNREKITAVF